MRLSKSKINAYITCPQMFKWQCMNELPYDNHYMKKGRDIHEILDMFFDIAKPDSDFIAILQGLSGEKWKDFEVELTNFANLEEKRRKFKHFKPLYREVKIIDESINISGIIDRIDYDDETGELVIFDYKTGNVTPKSFKDMIFELTLYSYLVYVKTKRVIKKIGVIALKTGRVYTIDINDRNVNDMKYKIMKVREGIDDERFPAIEGKQCFWCPYKQICRKQKENIKQAKIDKIGED